VNTPDELLAQLRAAAAGSSWSAELKAFLLRQNCYGFTFNPVKVEDARTELLLGSVIKLRYRAAAAVFQMLHEQKIPYAAVKGAVLSRRIYGKETARHSGDVDLLLPREYADQLKQCFLENGFIQGYLRNGKVIPYTRREIIFQSAQSHQIASFLRADENPLCPFVNYDGNIELFWGESGRRTDMESFLSDTVPMTVGGQCVQTLPPEKEFIALCLHHYKDWNSVYLLAEQGTALSHFFDILGYLLSVKPDIQKLRQISEAFGAVEYVYFCLWYTYSLLEHPALIPYLEAMKTPAGEALENTYGLSESERRTWTISLSERIFDPEFSARFTEGLRESDMEKIKTNRAMMQSGGGERF